METYLFIFIYFLEKPELSKCFNETSFFPVSFRLYEKSECQEYFKLIQTDHYKNELKKESPIQHVLKTGYGVHRGVGVYLVDDEVENNLLSNYSRGIISILIISRRKMRRNR